MLQSGDQRHSEISAPQPFQDYTEAGREETHRDSGGLQLRVQKRTRLNLRGPMGPRGLLRDEYLLIHDKMLEPPSVPMAVITRQVSI